MPLYLGARRPLQAMEGRIVNPVVRVLLWVPWYGLWQPALANCPWTNGYTGSAILALQREFPSHFWYCLMIYQDGLLDLMVLTEGSIEGPLRPNSPSW